MYLLKTFNAKYFYENFRKILNIDPRASNFRKILNSNYTTTECL